VKMSSSWTTPFAGENGSALRVSDQIGCASTPLETVSPLYGSPFPSQLVPAPRGRLAVAGIACAGP
jgi:hypothetical protein